VSPVEQVRSPVDRLYARRGWLARAATLGPAVVLAAAAGWVLTFDPTDRVSDPTGPCLWHELTGVNGLTCGGTRMFWYLLHGDVIEAARHHLLALIAVPFLLYGYVAWIVNVWLGVRLPMPRLSRRWYVGYAIAFVVYAVVLRNLPWAPFSWFNIDYLG
jgi:hypothetical protein